MIALGERLWIATGPNMHRLWCWSLGGPMGVSCEFGLQGASLDPGPTVRTRSPAGYSLIDDRSSLGVAEPTWGMCGPLDWRLSSRIDTLYENRVPTLERRGWGKKVEKKTEVWGKVVST